MRLDIYRESVILTKRTTTGFSSYAVDPARIGQLMVAKTALSTGLLGPNTLWYGMVGSAQIVCEMRPAQITGIWLEGREDALRVPLPPMLMIRRVRGNQADYAIFAVKERPMDDQAELFEPPLPNIYSRNAVCWGNVRKVSPEALAANELSADWRMFLGSPFGGHSVNQKSKAHKEDVRKQLTALEGATEYPLDDLMNTGMKFKRAIERMQE